MNKNKNKHKLRRQSIQPVAKEMLTRLTFQLERQLWVGFKRIFSCLCCFVCKYTHKVKRWKDGNAVKTLWTKKIAVALKNRIWGEKKSILFSLSLISIFFLSSQDLIQWTLPALCTPSQLCFKLPLEIFVFKMGQSVIPSSLTTMDQSFFVLKYSLLLVLFA